MFRNCYLYLFFLSILLVLSACGGFADNENEDKSITVLVEGGSPAEDVAQETKEEFSEKSGYEVKIESVPYSGVYDKMTTEINSESGAFDVATIDTIWLPNLYEGLEPIDKDAVEEMEDDFFPGLIDGSTIKDEVYGIPAWTNSKLLIYREDLFSDKDNKKDFKKDFGYKLEPPKNWEEYRDVAKFFSDNEDYPDLNGTNVYGANEGDSVASWLDHVAQTGENSLVLDGDEVVVNNENHVKALEFLNELVNKDNSTPQGVLDNASTETFELFKNGDLAMMLNWAHFYLQAKDEDTEFSEDIGVSPMISGDDEGVLPGPWYQVIPKSSNKKDVAVDYLKFMYEKNELYTESLGVAARQSVFDELGEEEDYEHLNALSTSLNFENTQNRPSTPHWDEIESEALIPAIQDVLDESKTPQESLDDAKETIEDIISND